MGMGKQSCNGVKFESHTYCQSQIIELEPKVPIKKIWPNPYKIAIIITCLIEMLELQNFGHMIKSTTKIESCDKILMVTSWTELMTS